jgi:AcrR family transcriptional regulator
VKVDLARRAQIGQERRARTRVQLLEGANRLISRQAVESITIDDIVKEAGVAKGTFYVHFEDMHALVVAVADGLIEIFDELLQPQREALADPFARIAFGCASFIERAIENPGWASVVGRMASSYPSIGRIARVRLGEDLNELAARRAGDFALEPAVVMEAVVGALLHVLGAISNGRLDAAQGRAALDPILRTTGARPAHIRKTLTEIAKLTRPVEATRPGAQKARAKARRA